MNYRLLSQHAMNRDQLLRKSARQWYYTKVNSLPVADVYYLTVVCVAIEYITYLQQQNTHMEDELVQLRKEVTALQIMKSYVCWSANQLL